MASAKVTSKGQVTIPADIRQALGIVEGTFTSWKLHSEGVLVQPMRLTPLLSDAEVEETTQSLATITPSDMATVDEIAVGLQKERGGK